MRIRRNDIPPPTAEDGQFTRFAKATGANRPLLAPIGSTLDELIDSWRRDETIHILTRAPWSTPHLIEHILRTTGPAEVWLSTWSVKEQAVRMLLQLIDGGKITALHGLFDERIRVQCPQAHQLIASQIADIRLTKIHAKLTVVINDTWGVAISSSANLTRNPRIESYVISTYRHIAEFYRAIITAELADAKPFRG